MLCSLISYFLPVIAQRRLPQLTLVQLIAQYPHLRWLKWGGFVCFLGTALLMGLGFLCLRRMPRMEEERGVFLLAAVFCIPSLSTGVFAACTGVYHAIERRGWPCARYYRIAQTGFSWVPWAQIIAALSIAAGSLTGLLATGGMQ